MSKNQSDEIVSIEARLASINKDKATLTSGNAEVSVPADFLPSSLKVDDVVWVTISTERGEKERREKRAKDLLNEILRGE
ncbi:MAG: hypothetical protein BWY68_00103 [bacterium ADurb.Bin400]|nr:MAG: hypothetical protein BWY68_00103 [bacterium ADurb.Bin400]